jgi:hypothetical protein
MIILLRKITYTSGHALLVFDACYVVYRTAKWRWNTADGSRLRGAAYKVEVFATLDFNLQYMNVRLVDTYRIAQGARLDVYFKLHPSRG